MAAARALDVVGVHGPAADRGDGVLELGGLVQAVRVERDGDVVPRRRSASVASISSGYAP